MTGPVGEGIVAREADTLLTGRAREFLACGPADSATLVSRVCQLPGVPAAVAEHLARTLLGGHPEFVRTGDGRWALAAATAAAAAVVSPPGEPLSGMSFVVVDVETTGGRPLGGDRITEFAAVVVHGGEVTDRYETLVNPDRSIPPWISRLTNISWEMVREAPRFREVCPDVLRIMQGHVFVAHNARFDWGFVSTEIARASGQQIEGRQLCTVRLARRLLPQLRRRSLDYVADHYNVGIAARHRAMGDALATALVLIGLLRDAEARGCATWGDLQQLLAASTSTAGRRRRRASALPSPVLVDTTA